MKFLFDILIVSNSKYNSELTERLLQYAGIDGNFTIVDEKQKFIKQIHRKKFDVIIADGILQYFGYAEAMEICRSEHINVPFVLIADDAANCRGSKLMQSNPDAVVLKDQIKTLPAVVMNVILNFKLRREAKGVRSDLAGLVKQV